MYIYIFSKDTVANTCQKIFTLLYQAIIPEKFQSAQSRKTATDSKTPILILPSDMWQAQFHPPITVENHAFSPTRDFQT